MLLSIVIVLVSACSSVAQNLTGYSVEITGSQYPGDILLKCARTLTREEYEGARISPVGSCSALSREWLVNRTTIPDFAYVTATMKDLLFQPPMQMNMSAIKIGIPGILGTGSSVDTYFSTSITSFRLNMILVVSKEDVEMKTVIKYEQQKIRLDHRIAGLWQRAFVKEHIVLSTNTVYKLTLKPFGKDVEVYIDDVLVAIYNRPDNPFTTEDAVEFLVNSNVGSGYLHRITIRVS